MYASVSFEKFNGTLKEMFCHRKLLTASHYMETLMGTNAHGYMKEVLYKQILDTDLVPPWGYTECNVIV